MRALILRTRYLTVGSLEGDLAGLCVGDAVVALPVGLICEQGENVFVMSTKPSHMKADHRANRCAYRGFEGWRFGRISA